MRGPVAELRAFLEAALVHRLADPPEDPPADRPRRRVVVAVTFAVGTAVLAWALRVPPGDPVFYAASATLALVWAAGAVASGPIPLGSGRTRRGGREAPVVQSLALAVLLLVVCLVAALVVARAPLLRDPVDALLDHARFGSLPAVLAITIVNGMAEELYFRGALYTATARYPVLVTTTLYAVTTIGAGVPLLVLAAAALGLTTALQRRVTGGVLGPVITHVTWSTGMLLVLPPVLQLVR